MNTAARVESVPQVDPVEVLIACAQARAHLVASGDLDLHEAVDGLQAAAEASGIVAAIGQDEVQAVLVAAFAPADVSATPVIDGDASYDDNPADDYAGLTYSFARLCRAADAARGPIPTPPPCPFVREHGVPSAAALQREYERTMADDRAKHGPATSTLQAADYLLQVGDSERLRAWLATHSAAERIAIAQHLNTRAKPCR